MTSDQVRPDSQRLQQMEQAHAGSAKGWLGNVGLGECLLAGTLFFRTEARRWKDVRAQTLRQSAHQDTVGVLKTRTYLREKSGKLAEHVGILRPLTWEEERYLALP